MIISFQGLKNKYEKQVVWLDGNKSHPLETYYPECGHSPDGFEWGYYGSGPSQLAYAMLKKWLIENKGYSDEDASLLSFNNYQNFKFDFTSRFSPEWALSADKINDWWEAAHVG